MGEDWSWAQFNTSRDPSPTPSVYNHPKYSKPRPVAKGLFKCGEGFRELKKEMAKPRPQTGLTRLPTHGLHELLTCIRCGRIPNPKDFMVCDQRGHHLCAPCTVGPTKGSAAGPSSSGGIKTGKKKKLFFPEKVLEECCAPMNLRRGSPLLLQTLLDMGLWKCPNEGNGCTEQFLGTERAKHLAECKFRSPNKDPSKVRCYFHGCTKLINRAAEELIQHYKEGHKADLLDWKGELELKLDFQELLEQRHVSLIQLESDDSSKRLFILVCRCCEETEVLEVWLWNMSSSAPPSSPGASTPEASMPEASTQEASTPEDSTLEDSSPEASASEVSTPEDSIPQSSIPKALTSEASTSEDSSSEASTFQDNSIVNEIKDLPPILYNLKLIQVKPYDGVHYSELRFQGAPIPCHSPPEELIKENSHYEISLEKVFNSCVESTPNGHGNLNVLLKLIGEVETPAPVSTQIIDDDYDEEEISALFKSAMVSRKCQPQIIDDDDDDDDDDR